MALAASTIWDIRTGGSDTANGGGFDPGQTAGMNTDGAATTATGNSPVFSSASYNFTAGDVGAWIFIASGTNWTPGWYQIASVASNVATLTASVGTAPLFNAAFPHDRINTVAGCATTASPTGATWSIDYSQQNTAQKTYTDLTVVGAPSLVASSTANPFGKQQVGNCLVVTGGTNFNTGRYVIASVNGSLQATFISANSSIASGASSNGTGGMGGSLASPGQASGSMVLGNKLFLKAGTYNISSASTNISGGCVSLVSTTSGNSNAALIGYSSVRYDNGTKPLLQATGSISSFTMIASATANMIENVEVDGASYTGSTGISCVSGTSHKCKASHCAIGFTGGRHYYCEANACTTGGGFSSCECFYCYSHDNSIYGFVGTTITVGCISVNNTGASGWGFHAASSAATYDRCTAYGNAKDGFILNAGGGNSASRATNCISYGNTGFGFTGAGTNSECVWLFNCATGSNTAGALSSLAWRNVRNHIQLTADPFTNKAGGDYSLNNTAGGGALCRAAALPGVFPGLSTTTAYGDVGAVQHGDPAGGTTIAGTPLLRGLAH